METVIWVDAVCIDQSSLTERSHQVSLMNHIYSLAERLHVYVGEEECGADRDGARAIEALVAASTPTAQSSSAAEVLGHFFARPYFSRLWVGQEVLLACSTTIHCGTLSVELSRDAVALIEGMVRQFPSWMSLIGPPGANARMSLRDLASLLLATSACDVSDLRDKIFGLLGLVEDEDAKSLQADYTLMVREVYTGVAAYLIKKHGCQRVLEFAYAKNRPRHRFDFEKLQYGIPLYDRSKSDSCCGIPSWVPLWNHNITIESVEDSYTRHRRLEEDCKLYEASSPHEHKVEVYRPRFPQPVSSNNGEQLPTSSQYQLEIHAETGSLITVGYELVEIAGPLLKPVTDRKKDLHVKDEKVVKYEGKNVPESDMSTDFWKFDGDAILAIRALSWVLQTAQPSRKFAHDYKRLKVITVAGCTTFFLAA